MSTQDIVILGGGLAGLCLAIQLKQSRPETRVLVIEKNSHPVPEAAHKVGESSVEIGAHYFSRVIGQLDHFRERQLPKMGLRYFFDADDPHDLRTRTELGGGVFLPTPAFQIDRGILENHLGEEAQRLGATFVHGARVKEVELGEKKAPHFVTYETNGGERHRVETRWVVDAAGRASILKRKLGLARQNGHDANAVWWRYDRRICIDDWCADEAWQGHIDHVRRRWYSTVHLMGAGYWVWLIPLSSGSHSIGIVADEKLHPFGTMSTYPKAMEWLRKYEPQAFEEFSGREDQLQDFLALKNFSYSCKQCYSGDRWALVGEAGPFLDPFYSPGSDYIGMGNTFVTDLVRRDFAGERLAARAEIYNRILFNFFDNHLAIYEGQMPIFGDAKVMTLKVLWDHAYYWAMPTTFFVHGRLTDIETFGRHEDALNRAGQLNHEMQALFRRWHEADLKIAPTFVNIPKIPFMYELNRGLSDQLDPEAFDARLLGNLALLERLAGELAGEARRDVADIDLGMMASFPTSPVALLAPVFPLLQAR